MSVPVDDGEQARLAALHELAQLDTPREERFDRVVRLAQRLFGTESVFVSLVDADRLFYKSEVGLDAVEAPRADSFCTVVISEPTTLVVPDARADPRFADNPYVLGDPNVRFYAGHPITSAGGHRIGTLCLMDPEPREFSDAEAHLLRDLALWVEKELITEDELQRAGQVQTNLLPRTVPVLPGFELAARCLPAREVGGDFYDWQVVPDGFVLTLADVMGKGMAAAIVAATARAVLRASGRRLSVEEALRGAEEALEEDLASAGSFVTCLRVHVDPATGAVRYADAGHGLTLVLRAGGGVERLEPTGPPLGLSFGEVRQGASTTLGHGDLLVSFSDGVLDLFDGTLASIDRTRELLDGATGAQDAVDRLLTAARRHPDRPDDVTVVALARRPA